jgi:DNA-binding transcriptional LysR family regulator
MAAIGSSTWCAPAIELAATVDPSAPEWHSQEVWRDPVMAVMARDHPLARPGRCRSTPCGRAVHLFSDSFVLHHGGRCVPPSWVQAEHRGPDGEVEFILELAASGIGIAFLPRLLVDQVDAERICGVLVTEPYIEWRLAMVWRNGAFLSHAARAGCRWWPTRRISRSAGGGDPSGSVDLGMEASRSFRFSQPDPWPIFIAYRVGDPSSEVFR